MSKIQAMLCAMAVVCIVYYACQKAGSSRKTTMDGNTDTRLAEIIAAKRDFYNALGTTKGTTIESVQDGAPGFNPIKSLERICRWDRAKIVHLSGRDVVIVPLFFANKLSVQPNIGGNQNKEPINTIFRLILYRDDSGKLHTEVVSGFKDLNSTASNFSGIAYVQNWTGDFLQGFSFNNGQIQSLSMTAAPQSKTTTPSDYMQQNTVCNYIDWYSCDASGCVYESTQFLGCSTTTTGGGTGQTINNHDYGVAASTNMAPSPDTIINELHTPCFSAVLSSLQADGLKSELNNIIQNVFMAIDTVQLIVNEKPVLGGGSAVTANTVYRRAGNVFQAFTTLNDAALKNANQEFIAETMFHEVLHAYITYNTGVQNELIQHEQMINSYVDCELASLQELFPGLSSHDGLCMILQGMGNVQMFDPTTFNTVLGHYNLTLDDVNTTAVAYQNGQKGTSCPGLN